MPEKFEEAHSEKKPVTEKNKKFKKADIFVFIFCVLAALAIWLYAKNVELDEQKQLENLLADKPAVAQSAENT